MSQATIIERVSRRETHSPRTVLSILVASVLLVATLWLLLELVLDLTGNPAWLMTPQQLADGAASLGTTTIPAVLLAAGILLALLGLSLLLAAVLPGRRARHRFVSDRAAVVVDREVLASAVARRARITSRLAPEQVLATVGRSSVEIEIHPTSGRPVDEDTIQAAVEQELASYALSRPLSVSIAVAQHGAVGI